MSRFAIYRYQSGGCDYTIGCGISLDYLPKKITTMEEAVEYVVDDEDEGDFDLHDLDGCNILEISSQHKIDLAAVLAKANQARKAAAKVAAKEARKEQFEELKQEFGG